MKRWLLTMTLVVAWAAIGCSDKVDYSELQLVPVSGKVTLDGMPLAQAMVHFQGGDGLGATGITDSGGNYSLHYDSVQTGCPPGAKAVRITTAGAAEEGADPDSLSGEKVPPQYNLHTTLTADVSAHKRTFNFNLKSAP
jgi:hypothetical protein